MKNSSKLLRFWQQREEESEGIPWTTLDRDEGVVITRFAEPITVGAGDSLTITWRVTVSD